MGERPFCNHRWIAVQGMCAIHPIFTRILSEMYKNERCFEHFSFVMDTIDAFPEHISTTVVPVTLRDKPDALEYAARQGQVELASSTKSPTQNVCLSSFVKTIGIKKTWLENFKRAVMEAKHTNEFRLNDVMWEKTLQGLLRIQINCSKIPTRE
ncbi:hypothetical protein TNCV_528591 [Trichonephila clavipes]|nr:hypothetical protein TNCV_528591 [Trichonephila clavipes]